MGYLAVSIFTSFFLIVFSDVFNSGELPSDCTGTLIVRGDVTKITENLSKTPNTTETLVIMLITWYNFDISEIGYITQNSEQEYCQNPDLTSTQPQVNLS